MSDLLAKGGLPAPPNYAPTVGRSTTWWTTDTETPATKSKGKAKAAPAAEDQGNDGDQADDVPAWWTLASRRALADRAAYQVAGGYAAGAASRLAPLLDNPEADDEKAEKKLSEKKRRKLREAAGVDRARRFRRWCTLTTLSACLGSEIHLPQAIAGAVSSIGNAGGWWAETGAAGFLIGITWAADWYLRGGTRDEGATPVSQVRRGWLPLLVVVRAPFASALVAGLHADGILAASTAAVHHLFS